MPDLRRILAEMYANEEESPYEWQGPVQSSLLLTGGHRAPDPNTASLAILRSIVDAGGPQTPVVSGRRSPSLGGARLADLPPENGEVLGRARTLPALLDSMNPARDFTGTIGDPLSLATVPVGSVGPTAKMTGALADCRVH